MSPIAIFLGPNKAANLNIKRRKNTLQWSNECVDCLQNIESNVLLVRDLYEKPSKYLQR